MDSNLYLKEPTLEEYWYEQKVLSDPNTMNYNAGWDVSYDGYDYETGCINFPKSKWKLDFEKRKNNDRFFAYIVRKTDNKFIGYVNFHLNKDKWECGILIEKCYRGLGYSKEALKLLFDVAKEYGIKELYDNFESDRLGQKVFYDLGFVKTKTYSAKRFNKDIEIIEVEKELM